MPDPSTFYATLAQAAGTVLAIIGGFVISAALRQRDLAEQARRGLFEAARPFLSALSDVDAQLKRWIDWYDGAVAPLLVPSSTATHVVNAPPYLPAGAPQGPWVLRANEDQSQWRALRDSLQWMRTRYSFDHAAHLLQLPMWKRTHISSNIHAEAHSFPSYWVPGSPPSDAFNACEKDAERYVRALHAKMWAYEERLHEAEATVLPATLRWSVHVLAFLAGFGVVLPMSLLSANDSRVPDALLALFAVALLAMLWFLALQVADLRRLITVSPESLRGSGLPSGFGEGTITPWYERLRWWWGYRHRWALARQYILVRPLARPVARFKSFARAHDPRSAVRSKTTRVRAALSRRLGRIRRWRMR